ncbi:hypothetical protein HPB48_016445 [Haemaphysalis longicornis]|uniref:Kelch repeat protein n=1 Tax=Haemaphysalis longicornis TaxID=44386 RepID=A0A9J6FCL6_HAELO|nr:hypothetical protein HPB48_016445 [Haemaphysalis longicornis]
MHSVRSSACAAAAAGRIYTMGGYTGREVLDSVECFDALPNMTFPRSNFVAVLREENIYVAGGFNGGTTVTLVERYDIKTRQWHNAPDLSIACSAAAGCVYQDIPNAMRWLWL